MQNSDFKIRNVLVKCKWLSGLYKSQGALGKLLFAIVTVRFKFNFIIYRNFCLFWISLIYSRWLMAVLHFSYYFTLLSIVLYLDCSLLLFAKFFL